MNNRVRTIVDRLRWKRWGKWFVVGGVLMVLLSTVSVEATSRSNFCNSCHIMEPYYTSWKHSAHKNVECVECHIPPGTTNFVAAKLNGLGQVVDDVLHRTSTKPSASVSVLSCTRSGCHTVETISSKKIDNGTFKFDHAKHLGQKHLGVEIYCGTCHSHVKGDEHFVVNTNVCITCHLLDGATQAKEKSGGKERTVIHMTVRGSTAQASSPAPPSFEGEKVPPSACTTCHDAPKGEIQFEGLKFDHAQFLAFGATCESCHQGVTATPPPIEDGRCLECHTFGVERSLETREMHKVHTLGEHKIECSSCHGSIRHGLEVQTASLETFDCARCHKDQHSVQRSTYFNLALSPHTPGILGGPDVAKGAETSSPMFLAHVDCTGCHTKPRPVHTKPDSGAMVMAADATSCDRCHQPGFGERMIPLWQKSTHALYDQIEGDLAAARKEGLDEAALAKVAGLLTRVRVDGSWGVHNPRNTQQVLEEARDTLRDARAKKGGGA